jgi:hypothetical protein
MVFRGFGKSYWTVSLDIGWFERNVTNQLSDSKIHLTKTLKQSSIAQFRKCGIYLIPRKIAIDFLSFLYIINYHHNKFA